MRCWWLVGVPLVACDPTSRLASPGPGVDPGDREPTLPNEPVGWAEPEDSDDAEEDEPERLPRYVGLSAARSFTCALDAAGRVDCWGVNTFGQAMDPPGRSVTLDAGGDWVCFVLDTGGLLCQGSDAGGRLLGLDVDGIQAVSLGVRGGCVVLDSGGIECWDGVSSVPDDVVPVRAVEVGFRFGCLIEEGSNRVECFGAPDLEPPEGLLAEQLAAGRGHACAVESGGRLRCWGALPASLPEAPEGSFVHVSAEGDNTCAVTSGGAVTCWGASSLEPPDLTSVVEVSVGADHACALDREGAIQCWGRDLFWQASPPIRDAGPVDLGAGAFGCVADGERLSCFGEAGHGLRADAPDVRGVRSVAVGERHACVVDGSGSARCWGSSDGGRLAVPSGQRWSAVAVDGEGSCGIREGGDLVCWGDRYGDVLEPGPFASVRGGQDHFVALAEDGSLTCIGADESCGLPESPGYADADAGAGSTCAVTVDGELRCEGGGVADAPSGASWSRVSVGSGGACTLNTSGQITCWGSSNEEFSTPPSGAYTDLSVEGDWGCARRTDGALVCWGRERAR